MTQDGVTLSASVELAAIETLNLPVSRPAPSEENICGRPDVLRLVPRRGSGLGRTTDIVVATVAALLIAPILLLVVGMVLACMGRPVLFRQERSGLHGRIFTIVKLRTMRNAAFPGEGDAQRTPALGRVLRACSLDELPQLWNILRGDMALVGPRPTLPEQVERYSDHERGRLTVRPGLTGWAQVNGRNAIGWPARIELDLWYIEHRTPVLDIKILWRTALRVLLPCGVVGKGGINPDFPGAASTNSVAEVLSRGIVAAGESSLPRTYERDAPAFATSRTTCRIGQPLTTVHDWAAAPVTRLTNVPQIINLGSIGSSLTQGAPREAPPLSTKMSAATETGGGTADARH